MNEVVIKKYPDGLSVILNPDIPFESLYTALGRKFRESASFFGNAKLVISFEGRELDPEEERLLTDVICDNTDLTVLHIMGSDDGRNRQYFKAGSRYLGDADKCFSRFYKGTVRAGDVIESDTDIIVLGDVNPGGEVISKGNILILGTLYGTARAGSSGNNDNFVIALELRPVRVCIGDKSAVQFARRGIFRAKSAPKIVYEKDGNLCIDEISPENSEHLDIGIKGLITSRPKDDNENNI